MSTTVNVEPTIHGFEVVLRSDDNDRVTRVARYPDKHRARRHAERLHALISAGLIIDNVLPSGSEE